MMDITLTFGSNAGIYLENWGLSYYFKPQRDAHLVVWKDTVLMDNTYASFCYLINCNGQFCYQLLSITADDGKHHTKLSPITINNTRCRNKNNQVLLI
jgi:hypothetical protein